MAERKLTAEEKAAAEADEPTTNGTQPQAAASTSGKVRLAPPPFTDEFRIGDIVIPADGLEVDAATAQTYRETAKRSGITLREL